MQLRSGGRAYAVHADGPGIHPQHVRTGEPQRAGRLVRASWCEVELDEILQGQPVQKAWVSMLWAGLCMW